MVFMFFTGLSLWANPSATVNVRGTLLDSEDTPLSGGRAYVLRFFDPAILGTQVGGDLSGTVEVSSEFLFNLVTTLPPDALAAAEVWYELGIDTDMPADGYAGGYQSFGGWEGIASSTFTHCVGDSYAFGGGAGGNTTGGSFYSCRMTGASYDAVFKDRMENCRWNDGFTCSTAARIYRSTILGDVNLNNTAAGIAHSSVKGAITNADSASFNRGNLEDTDVN